MGQVIGSEIVGGIVGSAGNFEIENSYNKGLISASKIDESNGGGIAGIVFSGTLKKCYNSGEINGDEQIGGIVGQIGMDAEIYLNNCYNTGKVKTEDCVSGGIIGWVANTRTSGKVEKNYNIGQITGSRLVGGAIGRYEPKNCAIVFENNFTLDTVAPENEDFNILKSESEMKSNEFLNLLGKENWKMVSNKNNGYPMLNWQE